MQNCPALAFSFNHIYALFGCAQQNPQIRPLLKDGKVIGRNILFFGCRRRCDCFCSVGRRQRRRLTIRRIDLTTRHSCAQLFLQTSYHHPQNTVNVVGTSGGTPQLSDNLPKKSVRDGQTFS